LSSDNTPAGHFATQLLKASVHRCLQDQSTSQTAKNVVLTAWRR